MSTKFEQLLDLIVNEEMDKANELFHEIVVEKSRDIYENLIAEEADEEEEDESVEEASDDEEDDESVEEGFGMDDETSHEIGGDDTDDMMGDVEDPEAMGGDDMGGDDMGGEEEPATKDDVMDLKDALDQLTAEFEALMGGEGAGDDMGGEEDDMDFDSEEDGEEDGEEADDEEADESMGLREYRETVGNDWHKNSMKSPGPVGSGTGDKAGQASETSTKSVGLQNPKGRPQTGATAHNILGGAGKTAEGTNTGTSPNGKTGGLAGSVKGQFTKGVEKNISSSSKTSMKSGSDTSKQGSGYPGNNKSAGPVGSGTGDKAGQTSVGVVKSPLNGAPGRHA